MTDENKTQTEVNDEPVLTAKTDEPSSTQQFREQPVQASQPTNQGGGGGKGLSLFAILLSLLALGGSGYNWYLSQLKTDSQDTELAVGVAQIGGQISRIGDSVKRLQSEQVEAVTKDHLVTRLLETNSAIDSKFRDVSRVQSEIQQGQKDLLGAVEKINQDKQKGINQLAIDEISQLLKLGNNSAVFAGDKNLAIKALQLADQQLKELADPRYSTVRRKINEEIGSLETVNPVDIESVTVKLQSLADRIPSLKLENDTPVVGDVVISTADQPQGLRANAKKMLSDLVDLVEVQRIDQAPKPLLVPEQRYFLDQNIALQLSKAELGLLQHRPTVYKNSLTQAIEMLRGYFDTRDAGVKEVIAQIEAMKSQSFGEALPDISGSYVALKSIKGGN